MTSIDGTHAKALITVSAGTAGGVFSMIFGAWNDDMTAITLFPTTALSFMEPNGRDENARKYLSIGRNL